MDDTKLLNKYLGELGVNKARITPNEAEKVFNVLILDFLKQKITDSQLGNLTGDLFFAQKITHEIEGELPELAGLMDSVSELSWDKKNYESRYKNTIKKIHTYAKNKKLI